MAGRQLSLFDVHVSKRRKTGSPTHEPEQSQNDRPNGEGETGPETSQTSTSRGNLRTKRYQREWEKQFEWLRVDDPVR